MLKNKFLLISLIAVVVIVITIIVMILSGNHKKASAFEAKKLDFQEKIYFPHLTSDGNFLYYFGDQGIKLKKYDIQNNKIETVYNKDITYTIETVWSPDDNLIVIVNNDPIAKTPVRIFNIRNNELTDLNKNIQNIVFSQDSKSIYFHFFQADGDENYLAKANSDGSNIEKLLDLEYSDYGLMWLNNFQEIGFYSVPQDVGGTNLNSFNIQTKEQKEVFSDYRFKNGLVSNNDKYLLYNNYNNTNNASNIAIFDFENNEDKQLKVNGSTNKAVWVKNDDYIFLANTADKTKQDEILKISLKGAIEKINYSTSNDILAPIDSLMVSPANVIYIYSNSNIYSLSL